MIPINLRDIGEMSTAERIRANVERFVDETSHCIEQMASRARNRQIRAAWDEEEQGHESEGVPVLPGDESHHEEPERPVQSVRVHGDGEAA